jgi:hypothetical protein
MSERLHALAERKQLLLAQSRLQRLELQHHLSELRQSLFKPRAALSFAASPAVRPLVISALLAIVGRGRLSRLVKGAMAALAAVKAARAVLAWARSRQEERGAHDEWLIDEANAESFPASDPSAVSQPHASR